MLPLAPAYLPVPPVDAEQRITLVHGTGPSTVSRPAFNVKVQNIPCFLADNGAHAIALIGADLRLVGRVEHAVGEHQQIAGGIPFGAEIHGGLADRPLDHFDLFGGKCRQRRERRRDRHDAAQCDCHDVPLVLCSRLPCVPAFFVIIASRVIFASTG